MPDNKLNSKPDDKRRVNRSRDVRFHVTATEEEAALIKERMTEAGVTNMGAYARKMMIDGLHITLDLSDVQEMCRLLRRVGLNVNQLAKRANETGSIYAADVEELRRRYDEIWAAARKILEGLARIE
ncbi:mobilization protein [Clostridia bacterium]|nr:mobilization protein [Clostridia bacterium]